MRTDLFDFDLPDDRIALEPASPRDAARLLVVRPLPPRADVIPAKAGTPRKSPMRRHAPWPDARLARERRRARGSHRARSPRAAAPRRCAGVQRHARDPRGAAGRAAARREPGARSPSTCTSASTKAAGAPSRGRPSGSPPATASASATTAASACSAALDATVTRDRRGRRGGALLQPARRLPRRGDRGAGRPAAAALHRRQARRASPRMPSATRPSTPATTAPWPRRRPACISRPSCWRRWTRAASPAISSRCTSAPAPSCPSRPTTPPSTGCTPSGARSPPRPPPRSNARARSRRAHRRRRHHLAAAAGDGARPRTARSGRSPARRRIFITPGYRFRAVDVLMTNFHLPRSTLFMLVAAFCGLDTMRAAYAHAIARRLPLLFLRRRLPAPSGAGCAMTDRFAFTLLTTDGGARLGEIATPRGEIRTPAFMPVGTRPRSRRSTPTSSRRPAPTSCSANTYHLMLRPGAERVAGSAACTASCAGTARSSPTPAASRS